MEHRILRNILFVIAVILLIASVLIFISIHIELWSRPFSFSPVGINHYLSSFAKYSGVLTGTVAVCGLLFGFMRLDALIKTYENKIKEDQFNEWKLTVELRSREMSEDIHPFYREILRIRRKIFDYLFDKNFGINDKATLKEFFTLFIEDLVRFFEEQNDKHIGTGGIYMNQTMSYSYDACRYTVMGMLSEFYPGIENDFKELFLGSMDQGRTIDSKMYNYAIRNYHKHKK